MTAKLLITKALIALGFMLSFVQAKVEAKSNVDSTATPRFVFGIINDNFTNSIDNGKAGRYIGPDDFFTFSLLGKYFLGRNTYFSHYNIVTSRKYKYRYDLWQLGYARDYTTRGFTFRPSLTYLMRGDFNGNHIQNDFHDFIGVPEVELPYKDFSSDLGLGLRMSRDLPDLLQPGDGLQIGVDYRTGFHLLVPRMDTYARYQIGHWRLRFEALAGFRFVIPVNMAYSKHIRSGPMGGVNISFDVWKSLIWNSGMAIYPTQNLLNDELYEDKPHRFSPLIWSMVSIDFRQSSLLDFIDFF